jgi:predicted AAA+ superfamily ATPase
MIKRTIYPKLLTHLGNPEITILVGSRQAGKTTLMEMLKNDLKAHGEETLSLNLDREEDSLFFKNQLALVDKMKLNFGDKKGYVFIDEIQRLENAGLFLKGIYDRNLPYKLIVTGSGSLELKEKIHESLAGRKRMFEISTLSLEEFVNYKTDYKYENKLNDFFRIETQLSNNLLKEYLLWGGYPRVVLAQKEVDKIATIGDIYHSYLEKDIKQLLGIVKGEEFTKLLMVLADQIGKVANVSEISSTLGINRETTKKYLWLLKKTFIIDEVRPFYKNLRKELTKRPVFYFNDLGMRNYILNRLDLRNLEIDGGFLFQNLVYFSLKNMVSLEPSKINYWRTQDGAEVDFVINSGSGIWPIEVKYSGLKEIKVTRSMNSFIDAYHPKKFTIVNLVLKSQEKVDDVEYEVLPIGELK